MTEKLTDDQIKEMQRFSWRIRMEAIKCIAEFGLGHVGGSMSVADVLSVLYSNEMKYDPANPQWEERDRLVLSKGHCAPALYATLALKGFFPMEWLKTMNKNGTHLPSHADRLLVPGIDMSAGSLGQGGSVAAGMALAFKLDKKPNNVYLILGDGESQEGQVWEMALFAPQHHLDNLIAFVDYNKLQLDGFCDDICAMGDMAAKFEDFGWFVQNLEDGNDVVAIHEAIETAKTQTTGKPSMIILNTIKGLGWSEIQGKTNSHAPAVSHEQLEEALAELQSHYDAI
ncbi:transketolase [Bifidobacterium miconisargentati]|uniref:transketolase n=1 Tax=Bifidobacterium miconisargentati TaxID=2834437 RepID=UPI001BDC5BD8|nr:transketolase [Bifidobacterium miconisargentati]MBW3089731.1 transketolase [Bifidobacterium miconisargentati]